MKITHFLPVALIVVAGCKPPQTTISENVAPQPKPVALTPTQELAKFCRVCVVDKGEKMPEFLPSRLDVKRGAQTYKFCADSCREKFDKNAKRYALSTK